MSPSTPSSDMDAFRFPVLTGASNFAVWKTRVTAALEGKGYIGFVENRDYQGDSESDSERESVSDVASILGSDADSDNSAKSNRKNSDDEASPAPSDADSVKSTDESKARPSEDQDEAIATSTHLVSPFEDDGAQDQSVPDQDHRQHACAHRS